MSNYQDCLTVSKLNNKIRNLLEEGISNIWVVGEISNFHHHPSSGHMYFTLKDDSSEIRCTMFSMNNVHLKFSPENGMKVRLHGNVTIYERRGQVQLKVTIMETQGVGELHRTFEALKQSLAKEGLFEKVHKKKIPPYPNRIGVLTSGSGAAYRDILNVLNRRSPHVKIILHSIKVQGDGSSQEIVSGIELFNSHSDVDVIILARGGGSIEDLWAFNEEKVARSIFSSIIPIITGVGHETDFTIADFVSDLRAPTPSSAAEIAAPHLDELLSEILNYETRMLRIIQSQLEQRWLLFDQIEKR
ncbi:MAG: exodeoxyribonuclease VII large subunit, partial [Candidatus Neomarinimicrobiota bacterium]